MSKKRYILTKADFNSWGMCLGPTVETNYVDVLRRARVIAQELEFEAILLLAELRTSSRTAWLPDVPLVIKNDDDWIGLISDSNYQYALTFIWLFDGGKFTTIGLSESETGLF